MIQEVSWLRRRHPNLDHVVIGPPGVFVIDSRSWSGHVTVSDGILRHDGQRQDSALTDAREAVTGVRHLLVGAEPLVQPVLCLVHDEPITGWIDRVFVCSTANLIGLLTSRPAFLGPREVETLADRLTSRLERQRPAPDEVWVRRAVVPPGAADGRLGMFAQGEPAAPEQEKPQGKVAGLLASWSRPR